MSREERYFQLLIDILSSQPVVECDDELGEMEDNGYQPTAAEIRRTCLQIQAEWTEEERQQRANLPALIKAS